MAEPQSPAERSRAYRARRRQEVVLATVEVHPDAAVALAKFGIIDEGEIADRAKLKEAIELLLFCLGDGTIELVFIED